MKDYCENEMNCTCGKEGCCKEEERPLCDHSMMSMHNMSYWKDMNKMHEKAKKMFKKDNKWDYMMPQMPMGMGMPMSGMPMGSMPMSGMPMSSMPMGMPMSSMPMQPVAFMMMCYPVYNMNMCMDPMDNMDDCMDPMDDMDDYNMKCKCSCKKTK